MFEDDEEEQKPVTLASVFAPTKAPEEFFEQLREKLQRKGINYDALPRTTGLDNPPDCYLWACNDDRRVGIREYRAWLGLAAGSDVPFRFDAPGEPNYCHDCTPEFKIKAMKAGRCAFPNVRFETHRELGEKETVGVSRSPQVAPDNYFVFEDLVVPRDALPAELRKAIEAEEKK